MFIQLPSPQYPQLSKRLNTPFVQELMNGGEMNVNGKPMPHAIWNLIVSHRNLKMWCSMGMKPNRHWKVSDVKKYFGLKGSKKTLLAEFEKLKEEVLPNG